MTSLQAFRRKWRGFGGAALVATLAGLLAAPEGAILLAQEATPAAASAPEEANLSADQLDSLVAPIALYPDPLLAQVLVASTYPIDIIAAQQWLAKNSTLKGDALSKAAMDQDWDPSVQALVSLPDALKVLSENIKWTQDLGDAFLAQQAEVMDAVQRMRKKAEEKGALKSNEQQIVETKVVEQKTVIVVEPANPEVVYVPSYNPTVVYPPPVYPYYPMYYPPYYPGAGLIGFGVGVAIGVGISGGWGCGWGGGNNTININNNNNYVNHNNVKNNTNRSGNSNWQHNAQQRGGAPYKDKATASKYGGNARGDSAQSRQGGAQNRQAQSRGGASAGSMDRGGAGGGNRGGGASAGSMDRGGAGGGSRGGQATTAPEAATSRRAAVAGGTAAPSEAEAVPRAAEGATAVARRAPRARAGLPA